MNKEFKRYENIFLFSGSDLQSGGSSPCGDNSADGDDFIQHLRAQIDPTQLSQLTKSKLINDTLFDEGLRIAQQYGMEDFAEELKGLQEPEKEDNQEPANIPNIPTLSHVITHSYKILYDFK
jgi:hypothetical protein